MTGYPNDQSNPAGAIPVKIILTPPAPTPPYPNAQDDAAGAIPVYLANAPE